MLFRSRGEGFGAEVKRRILTGTYVLSAGYYDAYYLKAQKARQLIADDFRRCFAEVDIIAGPTAPTPAFRLGEKVDDPVQMYLNDIYTIAVNLAGLPGISIPCGYSAGLPVGLQLIGPHFAEGPLLNFAHVYQRETDWHTQAPAGAAVAGAAVGAASAAINGGIAAEAAPTTGRKSIAAEAAPTTGRTPR